jgi:drug/metabolite transporter (DMT)-like permease
VETIVLVPSWLWIVFTLCGAGAQTARNAMQRDLIATLGASGATTVRFLFGLPFAVLFLMAILAATGAPAPSPNGLTVAWTAAGAVAQILATGLMLAAMKHRSFVVAIAYTKTEPVHVAIFGLLFLGDRITLPLAIAIAAATAGVMLMSWPRKAGRVAQEAMPEKSWRPAVYGLASAALFAISAVGYRAGILSLHSENFVVASATTLVLALVIQVALILAGLAAFDRALLTRILAQWRPSLFAGFMGALASQFWFLAFALDSAARVRTMALIEIVFAQIVTRKIFDQQTTRREIAGMALMVAGVVLLVVG